MHNTTTPPKITNAIIKLCREINENEQPYYVPIRPESSCQTNECFWNVKKKIKQCGGKVQHGWTIWEWPRILVEAEFHAIWVSPENTLLDITPKEYNVQRILFLPDNKQEYDFSKDGVRISNIRKPLLNHPLILDFIEISEKLFDFEEEHSVGREIHLEGSMIDIYESLKYKKTDLQVKIQRLFYPSNRRIGRNDLCSCGSGKKYKKCCGTRW